MAIGWFEFLIGASAIFLVLYGMGVRMGIQASKQAGLLIETLDDKYAYFIERRLSMAILQGQIEQPTIQENMLGEAMTILKPEVDALIAYINGNASAAVKVKYKAKFFKNISTITEELCKIRADSEIDSPITNKEEERIFKAVIDAVKSDISMKLLDLQLGKSLE